VLVLAVVAASVDWLIDDAGLGAVVAFGLLLGLVLRVLLKSDRESDRPGAVPMARAPMSGVV
jgi:hypothetical protein